MKWFFFRNNWITSTNLNYKGPSPCRVWFQHPWLDTCKKRNKTKTKQNETKQNNNKNNNNNNKNFFPEGRWYYNLMITAEILISRIMLLHKSLLHQTQVQSIIIMSITLEGKLILLHWANQETIQCWFFGNLSFPLF